MIDPLTTVAARRGLAADRIDALRHAARPASPGPFRHRAGTTLVRIGLALGGAGDSPRPRPALPPMPDEAPACAGASPAFRA